MDDYKWLQSLKSGDKVFISQSHSASLPATVVRTTATRIMVNAGSGRCDEDFRKKDGRGVGADIWSRQYLEEVTPELEAEYRIERLNAKARKLRDTLELPKTEADLLLLIAALEPFVKKESEAKP